MNKPHINNSTSNNQTWWDAVCNCTEYNRADFHSLEVMTDDQFAFYIQYFNSRSYNIDMNERFILLSFLSYAFDN